MLTHPLRKAVISTGVAARAVLFVVLGVIALSLSTPQSANAMFGTSACDWVDQSINQRADVPGAGGENIFPAVKQWDSSHGLISGAEPMPKTPADYTLYEIDGMRGLNWAATQQSQDEARDGRDGDHADDCSIQNAISNTIAQAIFDISKFVSRAAISLKEIASNPSPLSALYEHTVEGHDSVVDRLNNRVFKVAVPTMILLTGLWVFGKWRKGDMREVWSGVGWAAFVVIAVSAFLVDNNYTTVVQKADSGIAQGNAALAEAVLSSATGDISPPCALPSGVPRRGMRISTCAMYDTLAFRPWAIGQFGDKGKTPIPWKDGDNHVKCDLAKTYCNDLRVRQVSVQSLNNFELYPDGSKKQVTDKVMKDKEHDYGWVRNYVAENEPPDVYEMWSGDKPGARISMGVYALVASLIVGIMVMVLSALTLLWHAVTLIMVILLPLIATIAIHPTQQKLLRGWWQTFVHSFVLRAGFGVILTILLLFYQLILPLPEPLGVQLLMLLLVTIAVVVLLKNLLSGKFTPQVAGADDALGIGAAAAASSGNLADKTGAVLKPKEGSAGRVAGRMAGGAARIVDRRLLRGKLQKSGVLDVGERNQRKAAYQGTRLTNKNYKDTFGKKAKTQQEQPEEEGRTPTQPAPRRTGRVSAASQGQWSSDPSTAVPTEQQHQPRPAGQTPPPARQHMAPHQPVPQQPSVPRPSAPPTPRTPAPEPPAAPRPPAPTPPRDPRGPNGRV
ncbi:hypothetical protein GCM10010260_48200 [Streptomyces filipinensis]|uniref:TrbL/VirB6 plasmid conjugal transfer protein n=1 Tax=Streptomyces filipinensis TaxID=66887 RepID=A0A918IEU5_9ACTN|nr:hypothetical protein [Streptomyces filipinensis]GGV05388.1 hypothetical protein GCM10010260_48200 [Streptomyces filipinensis]